MWYELLRKVLQILVLGFLIFLASAPVGFLLAILLGSSSSLPHLFMYTVLSAAITVVGGLLISKYRRYEWGTSLLVAGGVMLWFAGLFYNQYAELQPEAQWQEEALKRIENWAPVSGDGATPTFATLKGKETYFPWTEGMVREYKGGKTTTALGDSHRETWTYRFTYLASPVVRGQTVTPMACEYTVDNRSFNIINYYFENKKGIFLFARHRKGDQYPKVSMPPEIDIQKPIKVGTSWERTVLASVPAGKFAGRLGVPVQKSHSIPLNCSIESMEEASTIPAGTFKNCLLIKCLGDYYLDSQKKYTVSVETHDIYALGIGLIKYIRMESVVEEGKKPSPVIDEKFVMELAVLPTQLEK